MTLIRFNFQFPKIVLAFLLALCGPLLFGQNVIIFGGYSSGAQIAPTYKELPEYKHFRLVHVQPQANIDSVFLKTFRPDDYSEIIPFIEDEAELIGIIGELNPVAILPASEISVPVVARVADALQLPGLPVKYRGIYRDKGDLAATLAELGFDHPQQIETNDLEKAVKFANQIGYPVVSKPTQSAGSLKVYVSHNERELRRHLNMTYNTVDVLTNKRIETVAVAEYLDGREIALQGVLTADGFFDSSHWDTSKTASADGSAMFYDLERLILPADIEFQPSWMAESRDYLKRFLGKLPRGKNDVTMIHAEIIYVPGRGPVLIDLGARPMGSQAPAIVKKSSGISEIEWMIRAYHQDPNLTAMIQHDQARLSAWTGSDIVQSRGLTSLPAAAVLELRSPEAGVLKGIPLKDYIDSLDSGIVIQKDFSEIGTKVEITTDLDTTVGTLGFSTHDTELLLAIHSEVRRMELSGEAYRIAPAWTQKFMSCWNAFVKRR